MDDIVQNIEDWGFERGLFGPNMDNRKAQIFKLKEEFDELVQAYEEHSLEGQLDAVGDMFVVLCMYAKNLGVNIRLAATHAYLEIKDRQGRTVNGTFIKDQA